MPNQERRLTHAEFFALTEAIRNNQEKLLQCRSINQATVLINAVTGKDYSAQTVGDAIKVTGTKLKVVQSKAKARALVERAAINAVQKAISELQACLRTHDARFSLTGSAISDCQKDIAELKDIVFRMLDAVTVPVTKHPSPSNGVPASRVVDPKTIPVVNTR